MANISSCIGKRGANMQNDKERLVAIIRMLKEKDENDYENFMKIIKILMKNKKMIKNIYFY
ncbi:Uncharacterised protein [Clostridioides difficile]|uniref:hypothetical protein n=1 Tax=Clostridioides difficile TaxID=1496 RepID=UPI00097FEE25|nr:hypothetical protein [Clostridioides difficile]SJS15500.1 Uncharacterised protein [Clostridioides difficile]HBG8468873.1 hypothetical protein [Clostridioides difficile]